MSFKIIQEDRDYVDKIAQIVPLEQADRESLTTMLAGLRLMHTSKSPLAAHRAELETERQKNALLEKLLWSAVRAQGGEHRAKIDELPSDWHVTVDQSQNGQIVVGASRRG